MNWMPVCVALAFAGLLLTQASPWAALAAPEHASCCCTDSCPAPVDSHPGPSHCGCAVICASLPMAALPAASDFWSGLYRLREMSIVMDAASPEARRAKPLLPPPKFTV